MKDVIINGSAGAKDLGEHTHLARIGAILM